MINGNYAYRPTDESIVPRFLLGYGPNYINANSIDGMGGNSPSHNTQLQVHGLLVRLT